MNPGRRPIVVAAHVVLVGVLVAVVYTNLLRSDDESALSGVEAPGAPEVTQTVEPGSDRDGGQGGDQGGNGGPARVRAPGSVVTPSGAGQVAVPVPSSLPPPSGIGDPAVTGPTGDQYLDSVARLTVKLY